MLCFKHQPVVYRSRGGHLARFNYFPLANMRKRFVISKRVPIPIETDDDESRLMSTWRRTDSSNCSGGEGCVRSFIVVDFPVWLIAVLRPRNDGTAKTSGRVSQKEIYTRTSGFFLPATRLLYSPRPRGMIMCNSWRVGKTVGTAIPRRYNNCSCC